MGARITAEIKGVAGSNKRNGKANKLTARSLSWGVQQEGRWVPGSAATMAVSAPDADEFVLDRTPDKASADLSTHCCKGKVLDEVTLEVHTSAESKKPIIRYELKKAIVTSVRLRITPDGVSEEVRLTFAKVQWFYADDTDPNVPAAGEFTRVDDTTGTDE